jgi:hypothetical protein
LDSAFCFGHTVLYFFRNIRLPFNDPTAGDNLVALTTGIVIAFILIVLNHEQMTGFNPHDGSI